jgi:putative flippase GtrA
MRDFCILKRRIPLFLFFGGVNFIFSYILFVVLWLSAGKEIGYFGVAVISTVISTFEAYIVQNKLVWKKPELRIEDYFKYLFYQFAVLPLSTFVVPKSAVVFEINILFIQFMYTVILTLSTWFFLKRFIYRDNL